MVTGPSIFGWFLLRYYNWVLVGPRRVPMTRFNRRRLCLHHNGCLPSPSEYHFILYDGESIAVVWRHLLTLYWPRTELDILMPRPSSRTQPIDLNFFSKLLHSRHAMNYNCHSCLCSQPNCQAIKVADVITDHMCSAMVTADQTEAKMATSLAGM